MQATYDAPVEKVWKALTDKEQMKAWYFDTEEFVPEAGFEFTFKGENEGRVFIHRCEIIDVIPEHKLLHTWRYEGYAGLSLVSFEIFPDGSGTVLNLVHSGLESFPATDDFKRENFAAGWKHILGTSLKQFLEKQSPTQ